MSTPPASDTAPADPLLADRWLTAEEAGRYAGYSAWSMRTFAKRKLITHAKGPGKTGGYRFKRQWIDDFLESRTIEAKTTRAMLEYQPASSRSLASEIGRRIEDIDPELAKAVAKEQRKQAAEQGAKKRSGR